MRVCACVRVIVCVHLLHSYAWTLVDVYIICYIFVKLLITFSILMYIICYIMLVQRSEPPVRRFTNPLLLLCFCLLPTPPPPPTPRGTVSSHFSLSCPFPSRSKSIVAKKAKWQRGSKPGTRQLEFRTRFDSSANPDSFCMRIYTHAYLQRTRGKR